jgi:hypothetical protein
VLASDGNRVTASLVLVELALEGGERIVNGAQLTPEVTRKDARAGDDMVTLSCHAASHGCIMPSIGHSSMSAKRRGIPGV